MRMDFQVLSLELLIAMSTWQKQPRLAKSFSLWNLKDLHLREALCQTKDLRWESEREVLVERERGRACRIVEDDGGGLLDVSKVYSASLATSDARKAAQFIGNVGELAVLILAGAADVIVKPSHNSPTLRINSFNLVQNPQKQLGTSFVWWKCRVSFIWRGTCSVGTSSCYQSSVNSIGCS